MLCCTIHWASSAGGDLIHDIYAGYVAKNMDIQPSLQLIIIYGHQLIKPQNLTIVIQMPMNS